MYARGKIKSTGPCRRAEAPFLRSKNKSLNRPGFQAMIKEIERGGVGGILAGMSESGRHSFDRDALHDEQRR